MDNPQPLSPAHIDAIVTEDIITSCGLDLTPERVAQIAPLVTAYFEGEGGAREAARHSIIAALGTPQAEEQFSQAAPQYAAVRASAGVVAAMRDVLDAAGLPRNLDGPARNSLRAGIRGYFNAKSQPEKDERLKEVFAQVNNARPAPAGGIDKAAEEKIAASLRRYQPKL